MLNEPYLRAFRIEGNLDEEYLYRIPAIKHLRQFAFRRPVTFFVGENGSGKSTLLEALAIQSGFNPEGEGPAISVSPRGKATRGSTTA